MWFLRRDKIERLRGRLRERVHNFTFANVVWFHEEVRKLITNYSYNFPTSVVPKDQSMDRC